MAVQKSAGDDTHVLVECTNDRFSHHSDQPHPKAQPCPEGLSIKASLCISVGVLVGVIVSLGALAVSMYALHSSEKLGALREWDSSEYLQREELDRSTLLQVENMMENSGEMRFSHPHAPSSDMMTSAETEADSVLLPEGSYRNQRSVNSGPAEEELCLSTNKTSAKPLAHVVGPRTKTKMELTGTDRFTVLTKQWICEGASGGVQSMVQGGMIFHRSSGFLELPVTGVYFVYYQVMFRPRGRRVRMARSRLVACIPDQDCSYITADSDPYMQTESDLAGRYRNSKYQAGLFHFPAGTRVAILVWNELYNRPDLEAIRYDDHGYNTYMGAYLVDHDQ